MNDLTDRSFWKSYWESKKNLIFNIQPKYELGPLVSRIISGQNIKEAIELGGFPGYYAIFLKKFHQIDSTLLDYFVHPGIIKDLLENNSLKQDDITVIEADLFSYKPDKQYDLVLSCGLIEHFDDTKDIIARHTQFLNTGATLLITIPNFRGVNGWVQRNFDMPNYEKHNISAMDPKLLTDICIQLGLKDVRSKYYGKYSVWLENKTEKSTFTKAFVKVIWLVGKVYTKIIPLETKFLSPYIILTAKK